jgi:hypothetical protein
MAAKKSNEWTGQLDDQLTEMEKHLKELAVAVTFLKAARLYEVTPEHLTVLMQKEYERKLNLIEKISAWAKTLGGTCKPGRKHEDGQFYQWTVKIPLDTKHEVVFDIGRYHGPDIYDHPLDFASKFGKKGSRVMYWVDDHGGEWPLEKITDIKSTYTKAVKHHKATQRKK